jgi:hypothetical protein
MATVASMAVALTVLLVERNAAVRRSARTNDRRVALQLAEEKMNEILLGLEGEGAGTFEDRPGFRWEVDLDIDEVDGSEIGVLRRVTVTVWFRLRTAEDKVALVTSVRAEE